MNSLISKPSSRFYLTRACLLLPMVLVACGGGGGGGDTGAGTGTAVALADGQAPTVTGVTAQAVSGNTVTLAAVATDNVGVAGYCFNTASSTPLTSDACFQASAQKSGLTLGTTYYVWAKDAAGNISAPVSHTSAIADTQAPVVTGISAQAVSGNSVTLVAVATDNVGVTAYCFNTASSAPLASDACFQSSAQKAGVVLGVGSTHYVWAKDVAGNVSSALSGPCSANGYAASNASSKNTVCLLTDKGELVLELEAAKAPITVANFLQYVASGFYSATTWHRVVSTFMIQGGGYSYANSAYSLKATNAPIQLENKTVTTLSNVRGSIAMARTTSPNTATSQFFINVVDNPFLDGATATDGYAVFGKVINGLDVVDQLKQVPVQDNGNGEVSQPVTPLFIQWAYQLK